MDCNHCFNQFNQTTHVPRLLIFCGHSLCETCCKSLHNNSRIQCPECICNTFIEDINFLPKNLALLKVNSGSTENCCEKHEKKYEAFCEKEKILLCVDCILQDGHRNHDMNSIKNSFVKYSESLEVSIEKLQTLFITTNEKFEQNKENKKKSHESFEKLYASVEGYFQQLKAMIENEEKMCLEKLKEQFYASEDKFTQKNTLYQEKVSSIEDCLNNLQKSYNLPEIQFLHNVTMREALFDSVSFTNEEPIKQLVLAQSKNQIADSLIKNIEKNFKVPQNNSSLSNVSGLHKKQESSTSNAIKGARKAYTTQNQTVQTTKNQSQKNFSKKNVRKQYSISNISQNKSQTVSTKVSQVIKEKNLNLATVEPNNKKEIHYIGKVQNKNILQSECDVSMVEGKQSLFNSFMSNMTTFLCEKKFLYVIGGFDEDSDSVIRMNLSSMHWEKVSKMACPRSKFGCIAIDKDIYLFGGKKGKERVSDSLVWSQNAWKSCYNLKKRRSGFGTVCIDHFVYFIGGNDGENILNSVECLNLQTGEWKKKEPMMEARDELAVCLGKDNHIYAIGGFGGKDNMPLKSTECFDPKTEKWRTLPDLNKERRALAATSLADGIYAIGGFDGENYLSSVQKYEQGSDSWVMAPCLKKGRCTHSAVSIFDSQQILVVGGFDEVALSSIQRYSLITNEWEQLCSMPSARFMHSSVMISE